MKEFLDENYVLQTLNSELKKPEGWIKVPDGAEQLTKYGLELVFWKDNGNFSWHTKNSTEWDDNIKHQLSTLNMYGMEHIVWQRPQQPESLPFVDDEVQSINDQYAEIEQVRQAKNYGTEKNRENSHYFIDVSDVNEVDFYEIAKRYNVTDPAIQHILKKCLAIGNRGHKDLETDLKDILKTAKRALQINGFGE